jgi:nucleotide-binding universal stress UspA family protein
MNVRKILAPTDFSEASEPALRLAIDFAERFSATVTLVHAFGLPVYPVTEGVILPSPETVTELVMQIDEQLAASRQRALRPGVEIETRSIQGPPARAIVELARDERFDLIIIGTHGRTGLKRLALGSVAEHVVRAATVPVLTVRADLVGQPSVVTPRPMP